ncbi:hypothetical protein [Pedobacter xixiisoli]|uniref:Cro/C1-type HTH DNA-binding domain-containing protein n=1 Tax=Pedobacter xixiisoli TaxID=1476464 RepID=A0A285ZWB3_9SPHI|nr:hypothetical protein [Pedobacter xixiisoli]SOD13926.1 hypothetical protein SAMN06297358_1312 [Pedobacter xixiisoli]
MGNWKNNDFEISTELASIALLFEAKKVKRMYDIAGLFPTKISRLLGINSDRYSVKLSNPEKFSVFEILKLAYILGLDPNLILDVIQIETETLVSKKIKQKSTSA